MYTAFYGLREKPFALVPDPRFLYLAESHREALAHLLYGIDQGEGFISVTGEVGTGKTTICRTLLERLGAETQVAFLFNPSRSAVELLQDICAEFGLEVAGHSRGELAGALNRFLLQQRRERRRVLLIIDEAQNLSAGTLEQVRLLSNLETSSSKLIQILLLGQPELDRKLDSPELRQLRQRISVRWGLAPLGPRETRAYVRHRLKIAAGGERDVITEGALREIHRRTRGVPRLINVLCDRTLLAGYVAREPRIGASLVRKAAREIPDARRRSLRAPQQRSSGRALLRRGLPGFLGATGLLVGSLAVGLVFGSNEVVRERVDSWRTALSGNEVPALSAAHEAPVGSPPPVRVPTLDTPGDASWEPAVALGTVDGPDGDGLGGTDGSGISSDTDGLELAALHATADNDVKPAPGRFLAAVLTTLDPTAARGQAVVALLDAYGLLFADASPIPEDPISDEDAFAELRDRGLRVLPLATGDLASLLDLNHPALVRVRDENGDTRLLALLRFDDRLASLYGATDRGPLRVPSSELAEQWNGEAWAVWNEFEEIGLRLEFGAQGPSVAWLQESLGDLGFYAGQVSGLFDRATRNSLVDFQREWGLHADGVAGPKTRMVLYDLLGSYEVPRLTERVDAG